VTDELLMLLKNWYLIRKSKCWQWMTQLPFSPASAHCTTVTVMAN